MSSVVDGYRDDTAQIMERVLYTGLYCGFVAHVHAVNLYPTSCGVANLIARTVGCRFIIPIEKSKVCTGFGQILSDAAPDIASTACNERRFA